MGEAVQNFLNDYSALLAEPEVDIAALQDAIKNRLMLDAGIGIFLAALIQQGVRRNRLAQRILSSGGKKAAVLLPATALAAAYTLSPIAGQSAELVPDKSLNGTFLEGSSTTGYLQFGASLIAERIQNNKDYYKNMGDDLVMQFVAGETIPTPGIHPRTLSLLCILATRIATWAWPGWIVLLPKNWT